MQKVGIRKFFNGPESFTADQRYILGPAPELKNFFVAAGFNSIGIQSGGGAGMALAHWIVDGEPPLDLWDVDIRRLMPHMSRKSFLVPRVSEALGLLYAMHWPYRQFERSREVRQTPFYEDWKALGRLLRRSRRLGAAELVRAQGRRSRNTEYSYGRQNWFDYCGRRVPQGTRERVGAATISRPSPSSWWSALMPKPSCSASAPPNIAATGHARIIRNGSTTRAGSRPISPSTASRDERFMVVTAAATATRDWYYLEGSRSGPARRSSWST